MPKTPLIIYWSRRDFRLKDNPALHTALECSKKENTAFLPVFILERYMTGLHPDHQFGYSARLLLKKSLPAFAKNFKSFLITKGTVVKTFKKLQQKYDIQVHVNDDIYPDFYSQIDKLKKEGIDVVVHDDALTVSKETKTGQGNIYSIFTPFKNAVWDEFTKKRTIQQSNVESVTYLNLSDLSDNILHADLEKDISDLRIIRLHEKGKNIDIDLDKYDLQKPSVSELLYVDEDGAVKHFKKYAVRIDSYKESRDMLAEDGTSQMSVALAWGFVSARMLLEMIRQHHGDFRGNGVQTYISELIWREFYRYLLWHHPKLLHVEFQERYRKIDWVYEKEGLHRFTAWLQGKTGYELVDAAMQQIQQIGWMHNRTRMVVGSILTKNLGVDWRWGQEYFRHFLFDIDEASNNGGWQWSASVGADPKPIRIFNPELQAERFDPDSIYIKKWLKEKVEPIVPHKDAREEALKRYGLAK